MGLGLRALDMRGGSRGDARCQTQAPGGISRSCALHLRRDGGGGETHSRGHERPRRSRRTAHLPPWHSTYTYTIHASLILLLHASENKYGPRIGDHRPPVRVPRSIAFIPTKSLSVHNCYHSQKLAVLRVQGKGTDNDRCDIHTHYT